MTQNWHQHEELLFPVTAAKNVSALSSGLSEEVAPGKRASSTQSARSTVSMLDAIEQDPVAAWVENHAARAWQQAPPDAELSQEQSLASIEAALEVPAEASQLAQLSSRKARRHCIEQPQNPLQGHPRYRYVQDLSSEAHSFVQLAIDMRTNERVAIKYLRRNRLDAEEVTREVMNQRACAGHPHIVQLHEVFKVRRYLAIVMSYCNGGDLATLIGDRLDRGKKGLGENEARFCFQQIMMAIDYCHRLGISIRDIKVDNVLLHWLPGAQRPILKLCDFSFSRERLSGQACHSACGTPEYMAPEVLYGADYCGTTSDIWAAGVSLYVLLTGGFPFTRPVDAAETDERSMQAMFMRIVVGRYKPVPQLSHESQDILHSMLRPSPRKRIDMSSLLQHPWFTKDLPPQLKAVNADLFGSDAAIAADASFADPCSQSMDELAALIRGAPLGPASFATKGRSCFAAPSPDNHSALQKQERALAQQQQRERHQHSAQQAAEIERQIAEQHHRRLDACEAAERQNEQTQPPWPATTVAVMQPRTFRADSGRISDLAGDTGALRLTDALSRVSCASGSNGAVVGTCWPTQSSAAASRRTSVAQQQSEERYSGGHLTMQSCHQASNGELLAAYCRQQVMHRPAQQLAHHISQSITADQIEMLDHQARQVTVASWQQQQQQKRGQWQNPMWHRQDEEEGAPTGGRSHTLSFTDGICGDSSSIGGYRFLEMVDDPARRHGSGSRPSEPTENRSESAATAPSFEFAFLEQHVSAQPSLQGDMSCDNKSFEFDQPHQLSGVFGGKYADSASDRSCH